MENKQTKMKKKITNGFFRHKYIWTQSTRQLKSIIDYVKVRQTTQLQDVRVLRDMNCGSDHHLLRAKINKVEMSEIKLLEYNIEGLKEERLDKQIVDKEYECTNEFYEHLEQAAIEALGVKENNKMGLIGWWNRNIEQKINEKKQTYLKCINTKDSKEEDMEKAIKGLKNRKAIFLMSSVLMHLKLSLWLLLSKFCTSIPLTR